MVAQLTQLGQIGPKEATTLTVVDADTTPVHASVDSQFCDSETCLLHVTISFITSNNNIASPTIVRILNYFDPSSPNPITFPSPFGSLGKYNLLLEECGSEFVAYAYHQLTEFGVDCTTYR